MQPTGLRSSITRFFTPAARLAIVWVLLFSTHALAQDSPGRFELGGNFTTTHAHVGNYQAYGAGLEGDINFGRHFALDAAYTFLRNEFPYQMGLFGLKAGVRTERFGFFGKIRPGFITNKPVLRDSSIVVDPGPPAVTLGTMAHVHRLTEKALDLGGVVEYYPSRHWALRWDVGDTLVVQDQGPTFTVIVVGNPTPSVTAFPARTSNNFQFSTGVHYRF